MFLFDLQLEGIFVYYGRFAGDARDLRNRQSRQGYIIVSDALKRGIEQLTKRLFGKRELREKKKHGTLLPLCNNCQGKWCGVDEAHAAVVAGRSAGGALAAVRHLSESRR